MQPVTDSSNSQYIIIGNPDLRPEFTNVFSSRYNNFDFISGNVFFGNITASFTKDKIVAHTKEVRPGVQETHYLNANGYYTITGFYNISKPFKNRKYVFNYGGNIIYNNNVSYIESNKNVARNFIIGQRLAVEIKVKKWLESTVAANYILNNTKNSLTSTILQNGNTSAWILSHSSRIFFPYDFIFSYDIDKTINTGYAENVSTNPFIINSTLEKQFFKKKNASLKFQAFDILNDNTGITRTVTGQSITDTRTNRLGRYYFLSIILRLNKFRGEQQMPMPGMQMMRPQGM